MLSFNLAQILSFAGPNILSWPDGWLSAFKVFRKKMTVRVKLIQEIQELQKSERKQCKDHKKVP